MMNDDTAMKKTFLYLIITVSLLLIFVLQETLRPSGHTIAVPDIGSVIDRVTIETPEGNLFLQRDGENWTVGDEEYPGDGDAVKSFLESVAALSEADIIGTRGNYGDYGLDEGTVREVRFFNGDTEVLSLQVGNPAVSGNALYGRINESREVVLLPRSLRDKVSTNPVDFRNTLMAAIPEDRIIRVRLSAGDFNTVTIQRSITTGEEGEQNVREWEADTEEELSDGAYQNLFRELSGLRAKGFLDESESMGEPFARLLIEENNGDRTEIAIGPPREDRQYPVEVSGNPYRFTIPEWRARRLLLGIERYFAPFTDSPE